MADNLSGMPCAVSEPSPPQPGRRTRIYDQELRSRQALRSRNTVCSRSHWRKVGEANQKRLSAGFAMDSTTLTRTWGYCGSRAGFAPGAERTGGNACSA
jgi:hypothetical protein